MKLIFVRHGHSEANRLHVLDNRGEGYPLTERGKEQIQDLYHTLQSELVTAIISSPLLRAKQSAAMLGQYFKVQFHTTEALREYDCGELEGRADEDAWQIYREIMQRWIQGETAAKFVGGESLQMILQRFLPFIENLKESYGPQDTLLIVGHGGLYRHALPALCCNLEPAFTVTNHLENSQAAWVRNTDDHWICTRWGNHLF